MGGLFTPSLSIQIENMESGVRYERPSSSGTFSTPTVETRASRLEGREGRGERPQIMMATRVADLQVPAARFTLSPSMSSSSWI